MNFFIPTFFRVQLRQTLSLRGAGMAGLYAAAEVQKVNTKNQKNLKNKGIKK
jgi:hypothetical protein